MTCKRYTRAFLQGLVARDLPFAAHLVTYHNIAYMQRLGREIRAAITQQRFPAYVRDFVHRHHPQVRILHPSAVSRCNFLLLLTDWTTDRCPTA